MFGKLLVDTAQSESETVYFENFCRSLGMLVFFIIMILLLLIVSCHLLNPYYLLSSVPVLLYPHSAEKEIEAQ